MRFNLVIYKGKKTALPFFYRLFRLFRLLDFLTNRCHIHDKSTSLLKGKEFVFWD